MAFSIPYCQRSQQATNTAICHTLIRAECRWRHGHVWDLFKEEGLYKPRKTGKNKPFVARLHPTPPSDASVPTSPCRRLLPTSPDNASTRRLSRHLYHPHPTSPSQHLHSTHPFQRLYTTPQYRRLPTDVPVLTLPYRSLRLNVSMRRLHTTS